MKFIAFLKALAYCCILLVFESCSEVEQEPSIVFQNVTSIDAVNGSRNDQTVVVQGKKIIASGPSAEIAIPKNATVINGEGKYLIPGLWDAHVHLSYIEELSSSMFDLFLVNGVTSIRDTGGQLDLVMPWKEKSLGDDGTSPRVMVAGPLLDGVPTVYNGVPGRPKLGLGAGTPEEAQALVDAFVEAGVDQIKSYEMLTPESFKAVVERSKTHGKMVTGHVPLSMDVIEASDLGLRSMEHMRNLELSCSEDFDSLQAARLVMLTEGADQQGGELRGDIHSAQRFHAVKTQDPDRIKTVLAALSRNNTWQIPTLTIVAAWENRVFDRPGWREDYQYLPKEVAKKWLDGSIGLEQRPSTEESIAFSKWGYEMTKKVSDAGIGIMAGTDAPIFLLTPGFSLHEELRLLVKAGLTPMQALSAATLKPAEYFNIENELGTIDNGKYADLLLLDANPMDDITNTQKINAVVKSGKFFSREALDKKLEELSTN